MSTHSALFMLVTYFKHQMKLNGTDSCPPALGL